LLFVQGPWEMVPEVRNFKWKEIRRVTHQFPIRSPFVFTPWLKERPKVTILRRKILPLMIVQT